MRRLVRVKESSRLLTLVPADPAEFPPTLTNVPLPMRISDSSSLKFLGICQQALLPEF